jgi:hypothetical protein
MHRGKFDAKNMIGDGCCYSCCCMLATELGRVQLPAPGVRRPWPCQELFPRVKCNIEPM